MPASIFNGSAVKILKDILKFKDGTELAASDAVNLSGTTGNLQSQIDDVVADVAAIPDPIYYAGTWNASTNTPTLANTDVGVQGKLYQVNVAGSVDFGAGSISFEVGDKVVNNGTIWEKWDMTDAVTSVNGLTGAVSLTTTNISEGSNLYFTDERAQDAAGAMATSSSKVSLTYNDGAATLTPDIVAGSLVNADINASAAISYSKLDLTNSIVNADIASGAAIAVNKLEALTADRAVVSDGSGFISAATTTATEIGYVNGVTSSIQAQLDAKIGFTVSAKSANFSASAGFIYIVDTSGGAVNATLPTATANTMVVIKDAGAASTNAITLTGTVDGEVNPTITSDYGCAYLVANGTAWYRI